MREQTRIAKLKADQLAGRLVDADAVERAWGALVLDLRAALLALPSRVGARLGLSPAHVAVLDRELRDALEALGSVQTAEGPQARP
jgi:phage terminase Nu1 subunit (DNA packaging protein)